MEINQISINHIPNEFAIDKGFVFDEGFVSNSINKQNYSQHSSMCAAQFIYQMHRNDDAKRV